ALRLDALGNPPRTGGAEDRGKGSRRAGRPSLRCRRSARIDGDEKKTARSKHCGPYPIGRRNPASFSRLVPPRLRLSEFSGYGVDAVRREHGRELPTNEQGGRWGRRSFAPAFLTR